MRYLGRYATLLLLLCLGLVPMSHAQVDLSIVHVTTQDNLVLRLGPGQNWERLVVIPFGVTLRATGRSFTSEWIQVAYDGALNDGASTEATRDGITYGWLASRYLVWTGDILTLPLDGVQLITMARMSGSRIAGGTFYARIGDFAHPLELTFAGGAEYTGRMGSTENGYFWVQVQYQGQYYWQPTWIQGPPGDYRRLLNGAYLYTFGRTYQAMRNLVTVLGRSYDDIKNRWDDLATGFATTCNNLPELVVLEEDLYRDTDDLFDLPRQALEEGVAGVNRAIERLQQVCVRPIAERFATTEDVNYALNALNGIDTRITFVQMILRPIAARDPVANNTPTD